MEKLFAKMKEYIGMKDDIPFNDFQTYYQALIDYLMKNYPDMNTEDLVKAKGISMIIANNAKRRAGNKDENRKKFNKINEKAAFWEGAIKLRLIKEGMSAEELDEKIEVLWRNE